MDVTVNCPCFSSDVENSGTEFEKSIRSTDKSISIVYRLIFSPILGSLSTKTFK